jgi:hypothetical protein
LAILAMKGSSLLTGRRRERDLNSDTDRCGESSGYDVAVYGIAARDHDAVRHALGWPLIPQSQALSRWGDQPERRRFSHSALRRVFLDQRPDVPLRRAWQRVLMRHGDPYAGGPTKDVELLVDAGHRGNLAGGMLRPLRHVVLPGFASRGAERAVRQHDLDQLDNFLAGKNDLVTARR